MSISLSLNYNQSEIIDYTYSEYPVYIKQNKLSHYPDYSAIAHWHDDLEFIIILSGEMIYNVNGKLIHLTQGEGIFVNSRQLHHGFSKDYTECEFICILFHPLLLCCNEYVENTFVSPILSHPNLSFCLLKKAIPWQNSLLTLLLKIYQAKEDKLAILEIQSLIFNLWMILYEHLASIKKLAPKTNPQLTSLKEMLDFIQKHYKKSLSLDEISAAGKNCKSSCLAIFQKYLGQTPITFVTEYRLKKSIDLMRTTELSLTEISYEVGFNSPSYFSETFRKHMHCTPKEYRKLMK